MVRLVILYYRSFICVSGTGSLRNSVVNPEIVREQQGRRQQEAEGEAKSHKAQGKSFILSDINNTIICIRQGEIVDLTHMIANSGKRIIFSAWLITF